MQRCWGIQFLLCSEEQGGQSQESQGQPKTEGAGAFMAKILDFAVSEPGISGEILRS